MFTGNKKHRVSNPVRGFFWFWHNFFSLTQELEHGRSVFVSILNDDGLKIWRLRKHWSDDGGGGSGDCGDGDDVSGGGVGNDGRGNDGRGGSGGGDGGGDHGLKIWRHRKHWWWWWWWR